MIREKFVAAAACFVTVSMTGRGEVALAQSSAEGVQAPPSNHQQQRNVTFLGNYMTPDVGRLSTGPVRLCTGAAEFPASWHIEPDPIDRFDDVAPDAPQKWEAQKEGRPLTFTPLLRDVIEQQVQQGDK